MDVLRGACCCGFVGVVLGAGVVKGVTVPLAAMPTGTVVATSSTPFDETGQISYGGANGGSQNAELAGTLGQTVLRQGDGTLAFVYQFHVDTNSHYTLANDGSRSDAPGIEVGDVTLVSPNSGWGGAQMYLNQGAGALYPATEDISARAVTAGTFVNIPVGGDLTTRAFFITTSATQFDQGGSGFVNFANYNLGTPLQFAAFEPAGTPTPGVPEPMSLALLPLAVGALGMRKRWVG